MNSMMRTLFAAILALLSLSVAQAQSLVHIDESKIRAFLKNGLTSISIPISSSTDRPIKAQLALAWMSPDDTDAKPDGQDVTIQPGQSKIEVPLPLTYSSIWARLYYSLTPDRADARSFEPASGIVSLAHIANHVFEMKLSYAGVPHRGGQLTVFGEAVHPVTRAPFKGIEWNAKLSIDDKKLTPLHTNANGEFVEFVFVIPKNEIEYLQESAEVEVSGRLGDFKQENSVDIDIHSNGFSVQIQS
jgi:hypothetical protein